MSLDDPETPVTYMSVDWARAEARRRENSERMEGVDSVDEMFARRALPSAGDESEGEE